MHSASLGFLTVTPDTGVLASGPVGGPFAPATSSYTLTNSGGTAIDWSAAFLGSPVPNWASLSATAGSLVPGASATVTVAFTAAANARSAGAVTATVSFAEQGTSVGSTTRPVQLIVSESPANFAVSGSNLIASRVYGSPFAGASTTYNLANTGGEPVSWTAAVIDGADWLSLSQTGGTIAANSSLNVIVSLTNGATSLTVGTYTGTIYFHDDTNDVETTRPAQLSVVAPSPGRLEVLEAVALVSFGPDGGPFSPGSRVYTLVNTGGSAIGWSVTNLQNWVSLSANSGTLQAGGRVTVTVALNHQANLLAVGTHTDTITFANNTNSLGNTSRDVLLTVDTQPAVLLVNPALGLTASMLVGQPAPATSFTYTVSNGGGEPLAWTAEKVAGAAWLSLSANSGTVPPGGSTLVTVSLTNAASLEAAGTYTETIRFADVDNQVTATRVAQLIVGTPNAGFLTVTPNSGLSSIGPFGGPFSPAAQAYTLVNAGDTALAWSATKSESWLSLSATSGTLPPGGSVTVTAAINQTASTTLVAQVYTDTIGFINRTNGAGDTSRSVQLVITELPGALLVQGTGGLDSFGIVGGPTFTPSSIAYSLSNPGGVAVVWSAELTASAPWLSLSSTGGTLLPGGSVTVTVAINTQANQLSANIYSRTLRFADQTNGTSTTRTMTLVVEERSEGRLTVTDSGGLAAAGALGGPFTPASKTYSLSNTGGQAILWSVTAVNNWLSLSARAGSLQPGDSISVTVAFNARASQLSAGLYTDTVSFFEIVNGLGDTSRPVQLAINQTIGSLSVVENDGFSSSGPVSGGFIPSSRSYTLSNIGGEPVEWTAELVDGSDWVSLSSTGGTLAAGASLPDHRRSYSRRRSGSAPAAIRTRCASAT